MNRRDLLKYSAFGAVALGVDPIGAVAAMGAETTKRLAALEREHGGRLGVALFDTDNQRHVAYRGDERFMLWSTFKLLLAAAVLMRVDRGVEKLDRRIVFDQGAVLSWAPVTRLNVGAPGMSMGELCEAAVMMSDNTAANLLLDTFGGPAGLTAYARALGDAMTRLNHREPLNGKQQGAEDSTTPSAMLADMRKILLGDALTGVSRERLIDWLTHSQTGAQALRAGLPSDWRIGDKTGGATYANNDIAVIWPPRRKPLLVAAYYTTSSPDTAERKAVLAKTGRLIAASLRS